jgi:hypothetical protein
MENQFCAQVRKDGKVVDFRKALAAIRNQKVC